MEKNYLYFLKLASNMIIRDNRTKITNRPFFHP